MRSITVLLAITIPLAAADAPHTTGDRTTPPTLSAPAPRGIPAGKTTEVLVDGLNLTGATGIYFDTTGITARVQDIRQLPDLSDVRLGSAGLVSTVDLGPLPPRMQVKLQVTVDSTVEPGPVSFRVQTPLGTTPDRKILIERADPVAMDDEPNNTPAQAKETKLPAILAGEIANAGDMDHYKIAVHAGEEMTFEDPAMQAGSTLQPVVSILRHDGSVEGEYGTEGGREAAGFRHKFAQEGTYYVRVSDFLQSGKETHFYRIRVSHDPLHWHMPIMSSAKPQAPRLVLQSTGTNTSLKTAQTVNAPARIEGKIEAPGREQYFRFAAKKNTPLILEVDAQRSGSELDPVLDIFDASGKPVEIAVARGVTETNLTLRDHGSTDRNFRLAAITGFHAGDWLMMGSEIVRMEELPEGPDDDILVEAFGGQRRSFFGTSGEAHHLDRAVYKVQIHPPGSKFSPNGLPLVHLYARNDDGGPMYGRDSYFRFEPPADDEYLVRLHDTRGMGGPNFTYKLDIRPPQPDFQLSVSPENPNVPAGGTIPLTVTAFRTDGFDGPIDVSVDKLPEGLTSTKGQIAPGQTSTTVLLSARPDAALPVAAPLVVAGTGNGVTHQANPEDKLMLISLAKKADIIVTAETRVLELEAGTTGEITVSIQRGNNFGGRVPVEVRNLPPHVRLPDIGLNGVLLNENETKRTFTIEAMDIAQPVEQLIYLAGRIETRSENPVYAAPQPILLRVKPAKAKLSAASR